MAEACVTAHTQGLRCEPGSVCTPLGAVHSGTGRKKGLHMKFIQKLQAGQPAGQPAGRPARRLDDTPRSAGRARDK